VRVFVLSGLGEFPYSALENTEIGKLLDGKNSGLDQGDDSHAGTTQQHGNDLCPQDGDHHLDDLCPADNGCRFYDITERVVVFRHSVFLKRKAPQS